MEAVFFLTLPQKTAMPKFVISSEHLQLVEPLMKKYFDCDSYMLYDEIKHCVENSGINYIKKSDVGGLSTIDYEATFREHKELLFAVETPHEQDIEDYFSKYFEIIDNQIAIEDGVVLFCLKYMSYIYYKEKENLSSQTFASEAFDLEYESILKNEIYPELLSLYKMVLDSENRGSRITIKCGKTKIDVNSYSWFIDDMKKYFADRFPDLTLDGINNYLLQFKRKAGRKHEDHIAANIIWGTYKLLKEHHSKFRDSNTKISTEICRFILDYLDYIEADCSYVEAFEIKDVLQDRMKNNFIPKWNSEWDVIPNITEKQPETLEERLNQPLYRYNIYN